MPDVLYVTTRPVAISPYTAPIASPLTRKGRISSIGGLSADLSGHAVGLERAAGHAVAGRAGERSAGERAVLQLVQPQAGHQGAGLARGVGHLLREQSAEVLVLERVQPGDDVGAGGAGADAGGGLAGQLQRGPHRGGAGVGVVAAR